MAVTGTMMRWGTWEELILGGAVLKHGTQAWEDVASELRARIFRPYNFTPEMCKAKYEDLQERYCGCNAWFEELRKQRVAELKRELEKSEDSIGYGKFNRYCVRSLESKLERLKAKKAEDCNTKYESGQTESPVSIGNSNGGEFSCKETSKDGPSVGSFTEETQANWLLESQNPAAVSAQETEIKQDLSEDLGREKVANVETGGGGLGGSLIKKKRAKRKRRDCDKDVKDGSVEDSDMLSSADVYVESRDKEGSMGDCDRIVRSSDKDEDNSHTGGEDGDNLMGILKLIMDNENAPLFGTRLNSQRRARYKKVIRRHLDFNIIKSRISDHSISSARELFRDLLLLSNNALVFYPKNSYEYISALSLRDFVTKTFRKNQRNSDRGPCGATTIPSKPPLCNPLVKPRSIRPCNHNLSVKDTSEGTPTPENKKARNAESPEDLSAVAKKGVGRPRRFGCVTARKRPNTPSKGKKRARRR